MAGDSLKLAQLLLIDPFHAGSHAAVTARLTEGLQADWRVFTLPGRHWKWRMRGAAVHFADAIRAASGRPPDLIVTTSMLALADLKALAPTVGDVPSFVYFHENQLAYPSRASQCSQERDHHFGFTQLISARAATACGFNSRYNLDTFLDRGRALLRAMPDAVPAGWMDDVRGKSRVLPVPLDLGATEVATTGPGPRSDGPLILWNHRWEHDKRPEAFFSTLDALEQRGKPFRLAIAGPRFERWPRCFDDALRRWGPPSRQAHSEPSERSRADSCLEHFGPCSTRAAYEALLGRADIAVSTAAHEFFGIAMLEATHFGALPLVPDRLAYPEIFPREFRYRDDDDLVDRLAASIDRWTAGEPLRADRRDLTAPFGRPALEAFSRVFSALAGRPVPVIDMVSKDGV